MPSFIQPIGVPTPFTGEPGRRASGAIDTANPLLMGSSWSVDTRQRCQLGFDVRPLENPWVLNTCSTVSSGSDIRVEYGNSPVSGVVGGDL